MNVLSLFDGMSCGRIALERAGINVGNYFASEIDKHAIKVSKANWNDVTQVGSVTDISYKDGILITPNGNYKVNIDLVIGGSPCQSFSTLGNGSGFDGKSGLFYEYLRVLREVKPKNFLLENVRMKKEWKDLISKELGVEPIEINSNLVSAQNRARLYWTNIPGGEQPEDRGILVKDILDETLHESSILTEARLKWILSDNGKNCLNKKYASLDTIKANCLTARSDVSWNCNYVTRNGMITKFSVEEYEKLQTVPIDYTSAVSNANRYKMLGNGWTVDVIAHIFKGLKE